jgi:PKD repeat protein
LPVASFATSPVCDEDTVFFTDLSVANAGSISWLWSFGDGATSTLQNPSHVYSTFGVYNVILTVTNSNGCVDDTSLTVEVFPLPLANFSDSTTCNGYWAYFTDFSIANAASMISWFWDFGDGTNSALQHPTHQYPAAGTYNVTLTVVNSNGCTNSITYPVVIIPAPVAAFTSDTVCAESPMQFLDLSSTTNGVINSWQWDFGDGGTSTIQNPTHIYIAPGTYPVTLIIETNQGCIDTAYGFAEVWPLPIASFSYIPPCEYDPVVFTDLSIANAASIVSWNWDFGDGGTSTVQNPVHMYPGFGIYTVYLEVVNSNGCVDDTTMTVEVYDAPIANYIDSTSCYDYYAYFTDLSDSVNTTITNWFWYFGDGFISVLQNPVHQYAAPGTYTVTLIVINSNGCSDTISGPITIWDGPVAAFTSDTVCALTPTHFTDLSYAANGGVTQWFWDFGDGGTSTTQNPTHTYTAPGSYPVSLVVWAIDGCHDTAYGYAEVWPLPVAMFEADSACLGDNTSFTDLSIANAASIVSWNWNFGDGGFSSAQNPIHMYTAVGIYSVSLTVVNSNGCVDDTIIDVIVHPLPVPDFSDSTAQASLTVYFTDLSIPNADSMIAWFWDFGDGGTSTVQHPIHLYALAGDYLVTLTVTNSNGCSATISKWIRVEADPVAIFTADTVCFGIPTQFIDLSIPNGDSLISWDWDFGDGNTSTLQNPTHTYGAPGSYWVTLDVMNSHFSTDDTSMWVVVYPLPDVAFADSAVCGYLEVWFTDLTVANSDSLVSWFWEFGDGGTSTLQNPVHTYDSMDYYTVILTVINSNGCQDTSIRTIHVTPGPIAAFTPTQGCSMVPIQFTDQSVANAGTLNQWYWDFGDGGTSTLQNPVHTYSLPGIYPVTLIIWSTTGCSDTLVQDVEIFPDPVAFFDFEAIICENQPTQFTDLSIANADSLVAWWWDFGDGNTSTTQHPIHTYGAAGFYMVNLTVENSNGCLDDTTLMVEVQSSPIAAFYTSQPLCLADSVYFYDNSSPGAGSTIVSWFWDLGDGYTSILQNPVHLYNWADTFLVTLYVTNANGCTAEITQPVIVVESPIADFDHSWPCWGSITQFTDLSVNPGIGVINQWFWDFGDGGTALQPNPAHIYAAPGLYTVTLTVINNSGCIDHISKTIQIYNGPEASFTWENVCLGYNTQFFGTSTPGDAPIVSRLWDFGDGNTALNIQNPVHQYASIGFYTITLLVEDVHGCVDTTSHQLLIYPGPTADFLVDTVCVGNPTQFNDLSTPAEGIVSWSWNFGDPASGGQNISTLQNPQHTYDIEGFYSVSLTVVDTNDCFHTIIKQIYVEPAPIADFTHTGGNCANNTVQFIDLSSTYAGSLNMWIWDYGDGTIDTIIPPWSPNTTHLYQTAGQYIVTLTVFSSSGCSGSIQKVIVIEPGPDADFTFESNCFDESIQFHDITPGGNITSRAWDFDDPASGAQNYSTLTDPLHMFSDTGIYYVSLMVIDVYGCRDTIIKPVHVLPLLSVEFYWMPACEDEVTQFYTDTTVVNTSIVTTYLWDFGDGYWSNLQNPGHVYDGDGVYNVTLTLTDTMQCENSLTHQVTVKKIPNAFFDISEPICLEDSIFFNNMSTTVDGYIVLWVWNFDDGSSLDSIHFPDDPNVYHKYDSIGIYAATLSVTNSHGCTHSYIREIQIFPEPIADFIYPGACSEQAVQFINLSDTTGQGEFAYEWNFGDPGSGVFNISALTNPQHTYAHGDSTYYVSLIITNYRGCDDTIVKPIYVRQSPAVAFLWDAACEDTPTYFYPDSSVMDVSTISTWFWDFGDGTYAYEPNPLHQFQTAGTYFVTLAVQDTGICSNTYTSSVTVNENPVALFSMPQIACQSSSVYFDDLSYAQGSYIESWHWDFGDGTDTTIIFPDDPDVYHTYNFVGTFEITLTVTGADDCQGQITQLISVSGAPEALFDYENTCTGGSTQFYDESLPHQGGNIISWSWNFGDPGSGILNTSSLQNPEHAYTGAGTYDVKLIVSNADGCSDTLIEEVEIYLGPAVEFTYEENCLSQVTLFFTDTTVTNIGSIALFEWDFGDSSPVSTLINPEHTYVTTGIYEVSLTVTDYSGCTSIVMHEVAVGENPVPLFNHETACEGLPVQFIDESYTNNNEIITNWIWDFGDPASGATNYSTEKNPVHTFSGSGNYMVQLLVIAQSGCYDSIILPVYIDAAPEADFIYYAPSCSSGLVEFTDMSTAFQANIVQWEWTFEPGYQSAQQHTSHTFLHSDTTYIVSLIVTDSKGCRDTIDKGVFIASELLAAIYDTMDCFGEEMMFSAEVLQPLPNAIYSYSWNFGDLASGAANTSELPQPTHVFTQPGTYIVTLDFEDLYGCNASINKQVYIHELPDPDFTFNVGTCDSLFYFTDQSTANGFDIVTYIWDFGDGSAPVIISGASGDVVHAFSTVGTYTVTLTVEGSNGCYNSISKELVREECLLPMFGVVNGVNCQYADVIFADSSTIQDLIQIWYWDFGDGTDTTYSTAAEYISHTYLEAGPFKVRLAVSAVINNTFFTDTTSKYIIVHPGPVADFFNAPVCTGGPMRFIDSTINIDSYPVSWHWDFGTGISGDISLLQNPSFVYHVSGEYEVSMTTVNNWGCTDMVIKPAIVEISPTADFEYTIGCLNDRIEFTDLSYAEEDDAITAWLWNFGDGSTNTDTSVLQNPTYTYDYLGDKLVQLIVYNSIGCPDTLKQMVGIYPNPTAGFYVVNNYENQQGNVALEDLSYDAVSYYWDFGDGYSIYDDYPPVIHEYESDGTYLIEQVVWNEYGCLDTARLEYDFMFKTLFMPNALNPNGIDPEIKVFQPKGRNLKYYHIAIYNSWGQKIWESSALDQGKPAESWDGTFEGKLVPSDVYIWKAEAVFLDGTFWDGDAVGNTDGISKSTSGVIVVVR